MLGEGEIDYVSLRLLKRIEKRAVRLLYRCAKILMRALLLDHYLCRRDHYVDKSVGFVDFYLFFESDVLFGMLYSENITQQREPKRLAFAFFISLAFPIFREFPRGFLYFSIFLGNSLAILAGVGGRAVAEKLINERDQLIDITLSMNAFFYEALLTFGNEYKDYIIKDIEKKYSHMLNEGATTFWETIEGWRAFSNAGSLCHGWSALPVYYLDLLI